MPIGFFEEGAEDRARKIADLRSNQDRRTSVDPIQLPRVDWQGFSEDPIGAGLDALQSTLQGLADRDARKKAEQRQEALQVANDLYKAYELAGIEKNERQVADEFYEQTGMSIYSVSRQHSRIVAQATGRFKGRDKASDFMRRAQAGEWDSPDAFNKAWEENIAEFDKQEGVGGQKQGYLEGLGAHKNQLEEIVFATGVEKRNDQAIVALGAEVQQSFNQLATSANPDWNEFGTAVTLAKEELLLANPKATPEQVDKIYVQAVLAEVNEGRNLGKIPEMVERIIASGVVTTQAGRADIYNARNNAIDAQEKAMLDPPVETQIRANNMIPTMMQRYRKNGGKWTPDEEEEFLKAGGYSLWASERLARLASSMSTNQKATKEGGDPIPSELKISFNRAMLAQDYAEMNKILSESGVIEMAQGNPEAETWVKNSIHEALNAASGKLSPTTSAQQKFLKFAQDSTVGFGMSEFEALEKQDELKRRLAAVDGLNEIKAIDITNGYIEELKAERDAQLAKESEITRILNNPNDATPEQADKVLLATEQTIQKLQPQLQEERTRLESYKALRQEGKVKVRHGSLFTESPTARAAREDAEKEVDRLEDELEDMLEQQIKWRNIRKEKALIQQKMKGLTPAQQTSYRIWNGRSDGKDRILFYS